MSEAVAEVGSTANNYQILARLATGGMAEIFLARGMSATGVERYCVLKRILRNRASDVSFVRMFLDEARLAAQLQHPNVAQVYDIGKLGDSYFFTMEYVHGETVRAIIQRARSLRRDLPLSSILTVIAGAASGLHHAHDRIGIDGRPLDIVHRDVSPSNLMVSYEGHPKVVDFGVAKAADRAYETRSGTVKGKISYLSPEQARGLSSIDRRSDLFALGIVFWEMLTTERLYKRNGDFENMSAIVSEPPVAPSTRRPEIPPELDAIVLRLLAKDPAARFQSADDLVETLEQFAARHGTMISSGALSRFLRDMFGQRPEPWVEMDTAEVPEGVTVTSEPIPKELAIPVADDMDLQLSGVPKLELDRHVPQVTDDDAQILPTLRLAAGAAAPDADLIPTTPHPKIDPNQTLGGPAPPPRGSFARTTLVGTGPQTPQTGSGPQAMVPPSGLQHGTGSAPAYPTAAGLDYPRALPSDHESSAVAPRRPWQLIFVIAAAAVIGSLTMWFVMKRRGGGEPLADAAVAVVEPSDAGPQVILPPPMTTDAAVAIELDAAELEIEPTHDASPAVMIDAALAEPLVDAAVAKRPPPPPEAKRPKRSEIELAWSDRRYKDVVGRCTKSFPGAEEDQLRCTMAACRTTNETKARAWIGKLDKARRSSVVNACKNAGVDLAPSETRPPVPKPNPCELDPMSCQH